MCSFKDYKNFKLKISFLTKLKKYILHEDEIFRRIQYIIETLFAKRKSALKIIH